MYVVGGGVHVHAIYVYLIMRIAHALIVHYDTFSKYTFIKQCVEGLYNFIFLLIVHESLESITSSSLLYFHNIISDIFAS